MSIPSFAKSVKHAIIMQEKSDLMEKWPLNIKEEHKRTTDKSREFEHSLKSSYRLQENLNLPSVLLGKFEQKPEWGCITVISGRLPARQFTRSGLFLS